MTQADLFDGVTFGEPLARRTDPETSHKAAKRMIPRAGTDRMAVLLELYKRRAGLTDYDLARLLGRQQNSMGKRRGELRDAGFVEPTEHRRPAPTGSPTIVWRITKAGIRFVDDLPL